MRRDRPGPDRDGGVIDDGPTATRTSAAVTMPAPGSSDPPQPASPATDAPTQAGATADPAVVTAALAAINAARLDDPASIAAVDALRFQDGAADAAAQALAGGAQGDARWAAAWVYASSGVDAAPLRALLPDPDPSIRAIAAAALVAWGDESGIPVLVGLAGADEVLRGSIPPLPVSAYAAGMLGRFINGPAIAPGTTPSEALRSWGTWTSQHAADLRFDAALGTWAVP